MRYYDSYVVGLLETFKDKKLKEGDKHRLLVRALQDAWQAGNDDKQQEIRRILGIEEHCEHCDN